MEQFNYEKKIQKMRIQWLSIVIVSLISGIALGAGIIKNEYRKYDDPNIQKIVKAFELMQNEWYFGKDYENLDNMLTDSAINAILGAGNDPYTFYTPTIEEQNLSTSHLGCGFAHVFYGGNRYIDEVYPSSPADEAGLKAGDIIMGYYDGNEYIELKNYKKDEAVNLMSSYDSESITFHGIFSNVEKDVTIIKGTYDVSKVVYEVIKQDNEVIVNLDIGTFLNQRLGQECYSILNKVILSEGKIDKVILDLRDNGGGYVQSAVDLASIFLPDNSLILTYEFSDGSRQNIYSRKIGNLPQIEKIVIMQNGNTASASETFTVALRDLLEDKVTVIGAKSYGKGIAQSFYTFSDGSIIRYTMAKTYSPGGYSIHGTGVSPEVDIPIDQRIYYTYYGDENVLSQEMKNIVLDQINCALNTNYEDYLTALHAFQELNGFDISDDLNRPVAQELQKQIWDRYLIIVADTYQAALEA